MTYIHPLAALFCGLCLYTAHCANNRRRESDAKAERYRKQLLAHYTGLAPINEIEHRLALRKELRAQGFDLHRRRA